MKTKFTLLATIVALCIFTITLSAQTDSLKITYDASLSGAACQPLGAAKMYMHSGAGTSGPTAAWEYGIGNWGVDDGIGQMMSAGTDMWMKTIHVRDYYSQASNGPIPGSETVYGIGLVFRNEDGSLEGKDDNCSDIFIRQLDTGTPVVENSDGTAFAGVSVQWVGGVGINDNSSLSAVNTYPNPFSNATTITYTLNAYAKDLSVSIYNIMGQEVAKLYSGAQVAGTHNISWNGTDSFGENLESGVYFFTVNDGASQLTQKLMLTR